MSCSCLFLLVDGGLGVVHRDFRNEIGSASDPMDEKELLLTIAFVISDGCISSSSRGMMKSSSSRKLTQLMFTWLAEVTWLKLLIYLAKVLAVSISVVVSVFCSVLTLVGLGE